MGKSVVFAVAGSGKTTRIIESLTADRRHLILTFTDNNLANLRRRIVEKFGYMPRTIGLFSYFSFLHSFCYRPFFAMRMKTKGFQWNQPPAWTRVLPRNREAYYLDGTRRIYYGRLALFLEKKGAMAGVIARIEKYYDSMLVDEVQDFAGNDFNFLSSVVKGSSMDVMLVGDFYQHTFDTSRDGNTNGTLHDNYGKYQARFVQMGAVIDDKSLVKSRRCAPAVCDFVRKSLGIEIHAHGDGPAVAVELVTEQGRADEIFASAAVKLFYQEHHKYPCNSNNWGSSKGLDHYEDVCVVLSVPLSKACESGDFSKLPSQTKNKFYVACTRARRNLYLIPEKLLKKHKASA